MLACFVGIPFVAAHPASATSFVAVMDGLQEVGPNGSSASGFAVVRVVENPPFPFMGPLLSVDVTWNGLTGGNPVAAHIHCCTPLGTNVGVAVGFPSFPATTSGTYLNDFFLLDPAFYTASFFNNFGGGTVEGARDALIAGLGNGQAYVNIHNTVFPGGEIRGNLVPEPATGLLVLAGLTGLALGRRGRAHASPAFAPLGFIAAGAAIGGEVGANLQKVFSHGHRNGFGMAFDPYSGNLWDTKTPTTPTVSSTGSCPA